MILRSSTSIKPISEIEFLTIHSPKLTYFIKEAWNNWGQICECIFFGKKVFFFFSISAYFNMSYNWPEKFIWRKIHGLNMAHFQFTECGECCVLLKMNEGSFLHGEQKVGSSEILFQLELNKPQFNFNPLARLMYH